MSGPGAAPTAPDPANTCTEVLTMADVTRSTHAGRSRPAIDRLREKVDKSSPDGCWVFTGRATTRSGHRQIWDDGRMVLAHRVAYEAEHGPIPAGLCVCHQCDNPPCCNPAHLFLGTVADNNADRDHKGRGVLPPESAMRRLRPGPIKHGTIYAYVKRRCRCDECRSAMREYRRSRRAS